MGLVNTKKIFEMAYKNSYAGGEFNVNNAEISKSIISEVTRRMFTTGLVNFLQEEKCARLVYPRHLFDAT